MRPCARPGLGHRRHPAGRCTCPDGSRCCAAPATSGPACNRTARPSVPQSSRKRHPDPRCPRLRTGPADPDRCGWRCTGGASGRRPAAWGQQASFQSPGPAGCGHRSTCPARCSSAKPRSGPRSNRWGRWNATPPSGWGGWGSGHSLSHRRFRPRTGCTAADPERSGHSSGSAALGCRAARQCGGRARSRPRGTAPVPPG